MSSIMRARSALTGRGEGWEVIGGSSLELKVAAPSMLGIGCPGRHALLLTPPQKAPTVTRAPIPRERVRSRVNKMVYRGDRGSSLDDECGSPFSDDSGSRSGDLDHRERSYEMVHFVGLDVSVKTTSVCVVDDAGKVILEQKVPTDPADIIAILTSLGVSFGRIGIEAGPLSQWLVNALVAADLPVICVETRHMKALLTAQQISKTDRNDARGIAQMMRVGLFKPVHVKTLVAQEQRMLLTSRKLLQRKLLDVEADLRGTLRNFGLKVGVVSGGRYEARVRELVAGFPRLAAIVEPLLSVRRVMRQQFAVLHK